MKMKLSTEEKFINIAAIMAFLIIVGAAVAVYGAKF